MSTNEGVEENKRLALAAVAAFSARDLAALATLFSRKATWWYVPSIAGGGQYVPIEVMMRNWASFFPTLRNFSLQPVGITAEGDRVAVEIEGKGETTKGLRYDNFFHNLFIFENKLIVGVKEHSDTLLISKILQHEIEVVA
jgi:ketosteroid isomerase-like protein